MAFLAANPTARPATRASAATSAVVIASSSSETKNRAGGLFGHLLGDGYGERDERLPTRACSLPHSYLREPLVKTLRKRCRVPNWCLSESASQIHNLRPRGPSCNTPSCITRNVLQTRSLPHLGMSSKASPSNRVRSGREEGCGGAIHGRAQGGDQADGKALQQGRQGREGQDARRTMRPHRLDSPARPAGAHRGPPSPGPARPT